MTLSERYSRQERFGPIGADGQRRLREARAVVVGCGALGSGVVANLGRAGVGAIRIVDRDALDVTNLQRQNLFTESDCRERLPKAVAAVRHMHEINSQIALEPCVEDVRPGNVEDLLAGADVVVDGTDNVETRYLLNDACVKGGIPWVYGGAVGSTGLSMTIRPGISACLRCAFEEMPSAGSLPTCHTDGILNTITALVSAVQSTEAIKILVASSDINTGLLNIDIWQNSFRRIGIDRRPDCPACVLERYDFLKATPATSTTSLWGRNAVHFSPERPLRIDLTELADRLSHAGEAAYNGYLVTARLEGVDAIVFPGGRVLFEGTTDEDLARRLAARYIVSPEGTAPWG